VRRGRTWSSWAADSAGSTRPARSRSGRSASPCSTAAITILFQPLLYQVATAALNPSDIATPLRSILRRASNVTVFLAQVESVDLAGRRLVLDDGPMAYDALVLAAGAGHSYFGHDDWEPLAPKPQDPGGRAGDPAPRAGGLRGRRAGAGRREQRALLTSVVIGGGPTGVELAGALAEISRETIARDFRLIDPPRRASCCSRAARASWPPSPIPCPHARPPRSPASGSRSAPAPPSRA